MISSQSIPPAPGLIASVFRGTISLGVVSILAFSIWAFGGVLFRFPGGEVVMYAAIAVVFLGLTGYLMHPLIGGPRSFQRFQSVFLPSFLAYAIVWSAIWFLLPNRKGEWLASAAGCLAFTSMLAWRLRSWHAFLISTAGFFALHTAGYFAGSWSMYSLLAVAKAGQHPELSRKTWMILAKLSWGLFYGMGLGAGLGLGLALGRPRSSSADQNS